MPSVSHDNKTLPFKPGQILLAIYHSQTKLNIFCKVINFSFHSLSLKKVIFSYIQKKFSISDKKQNE